MDPVGLGANVAIEDAQTVAVDVPFLHDLAVSVIVAEQFPEDTELSVTMVTDERIAELNSEYLGKAGSTDVLSFPLHELEPGSPPDPAPNSPPFTLGDVLIAPSYVRRQAEELEVGFNDEMALMLVHGILHLMGYDHRDDADAELMESREAEILGAAGVGRR